MFDEVSVGIGIVQNFHAICFYLRLMEPQMHTDRLL